MEFLENFIQNIWKIYNEQVLKAKCINFSLAPLNQILIVLTFIYITLNEQPMIMKLSNFPELIIRHVLR